VGTDDVASILALDADCVCYAPLGGTLDGGRSAVEDICRLLASGKNVVSSAHENLAYIGPDVHLPGAGPDVYERLTTACHQGGVSFLHVGVNPGFAMDLWPMQLTRLCGRIDFVRVSEVVDMSRNPSIHMVRDAIGFGLPADAPSALDAHFGQVETSPFALSLRAFADAVGVTLDHISYRREVATTDRELTIAAGTIGAGTIAAMKVSLEGWVAGRPGITFELIWRVTDGVAPQWPHGDSRWLLHIDGDMSVDSEIALATGHGARRAVSLAVATLLLNAVPSVCAADAGLLNNLTLPPHAGGYFARRPSPTPG
jgi:4-hydroxy-tetrahydrodipicolinate reductase